MREHCVPAGSLAGVGVGGVWGQSTHRLYEPSWGLCVVPDPWAETCATWWGTTAGGAAPALYRRSPQTRPQEVGPRGNGDRVELPSPRASAQHRRAGGAIPSWPGKLAGCQLLEVIHTILANGQPPLSPGLLLHDNTNLLGGPIFQLWILLGVLEVPLLAEPGVAIKANAPFRWTRLQRDRVRQSGETPWQQGVTGKPMGNQTHIPRANQMQTQNM